MDNPWVIVLLVVFLIATGTVLYAIFGPRGVLSTNEDKATEETTTE